ncbi:MAG: sulfurtransferase complex subunit TusB [Vibrio sp.]|uniref:sulfurtransferase complex subunit TusB n=1 Tax=Vibrio sp. TaxID=678 RepID=UPI003A880DD0
MLHIVKSLEKLKLVSRYLQPTDTLLLVENAIYASSPQAGYDAHIVRAGQVFVLQEDLQARGWSEKVAPNMQIINRFEFVELTINHSKSISW